MKIIYFLCFIVTFAIHISLRVFLNYGWYEGIKLFLMSLTSGLFSIIVYLCIEKLRAWAHNPK